MTKFKGRSALKHYLPLQPTKRGIKIWERCDSNTGYVYDLNIYSGREAGCIDGTLGERVVKKLTETLRDKNVLIWYDRFFTSVNLMNSLPLPQVGTCISNRKICPNSK